MEIRSNLASLLYSSTRSATDVGQQAAETSGIAAAAKDFVQTLQQGEETAKLGLVGRADPLSVVEALAATELAVETAVTLRDRVVEAYQEILRMPV